VGLEARGEGYQLRAMGLVCHTCITTVFSRNTISVVVNESRSGCPRVYEGLTMVPRPRGDADRETPCLCFGDGAHDTALVCSFE
jgi:hypothetical protein